MIGDWRLVVLGSSVRLEFGLDWTGLDWTGLGLVLGWFEA